METKETLADRVLREAYRPHTRLRYIIRKRSMGDLRSALGKARKFVLDKRMSAFLADLSIVPFELHPDRQAETLDSLRHSARLPFPITWIEFEGRAFREQMLKHPKSHTLSPAGMPLISSAQVPQVWGFLLEEHPQVPSAVMSREFTHSDDDDIGVMSVPYTSVWQTTDDTIPWRDADTQNGMLVHGLLGHFCPQIGAVLDDRADLANANLKQRIHVGEDVEFDTLRVLVETAGVARYLLALLATLNDVPTLMTEAKQSRGFVARGRYRKFMDYSVVQLNVPMTMDTRRLARKVIAMARRRAHMVRSHFRTFPHEVENPCQVSFHNWTETDERGHSHCTNCKMKRTLIPQHQRGDANLGWVTHDYAVSHSERV